MEAENGLVILGSYPGTPRRTCAGRALGIGDHKLGDSMGEAVCIAPARAVTAGMSYRASAPAGNLANPKFTPFFYKSGW